MCVRVKIVSTVVILILFSPVFTTVSFENDQCNERSTVPDNDNFDNENEIFNKAENLLANTPRAFTANRGQLENDEVLFYEQGGAVWFGADEVFFELREYADTRGQGSQLRGQGRVRIGNRELGMGNRDIGLKTDDWEQTIREYRRVVLKQEFIGANHIKPIGRECLSWQSNFFYGNDSENWCIDVPNYSEIWYENIYDGIDLRYYTNEKGLKYDFIVHPGGNFDQIRIKYEGVECLELDDSGDLNIKTKLYILKDTKLFIYQKNNNNNKNIINGYFKLYSNLEYGFGIFDDYDKQKPVIIDPFIEFSTFFGGNSFEYPFGIYVDKNRSSYLTGITNSIDFNTTPGAYNTSHNRKYADGYVIKFNQNGSALEYATFLGGSNWNYCRDISIDKNGNAYIAGETNSSDFPTTSSAFDQSFNGAWDIFVSKLNCNGSQLIYSTYIGSDQHEDAWGIVVDGNGSALITGLAMSNNFPTTSNAYDTNLNGISDVYVLKLCPNGSSLVFSTFLGGTKDENGYGIDIDHNDNVYITGNTVSDDFPTTPGAFDRTINSAAHQQSYDVFVSKLNYNGTQLLYSTYVGGWHNDYGRKIVVDSNCYAYVTGYTPSNDFPTTPGAYDTTYNGGGDVGDSFTFKLNYNASTLIYSTFIGGNAWDIGLDISIDAEKNAYVFGYTNSTNFPTTSDAYSRYLNGSYDAFICQLDKFGSMLIYSTYFGGSSYEVGFCGALDSRTNIYIAGYTDSANFPTTPGAYNRTLPGARAGFLSKFSYSKMLNISFLEFLYRNQPTKIAYSRLGTYSFRLKIIDSNVPKVLKDLTILIDPGGTNIELTWSSTQNRFYKSNDENNFITIENSSIIYQFVAFSIIDFDVTFNWTYPHEDLNDVQVRADGLYSMVDYLNVSDLFRVENDLVFNGTFRVRGADERILQQFDLVRGGERLNWAGTLPIYEDSDNIIPPTSEFNVSIWDNSSHCWLAESLFNSTDMNEKIFNGSSCTASETNTLGEPYTINLTGIPPECDKTNRTFIIRIDGDNVTFSEAIPLENKWHTTSEVYVGISITDIGGAGIDNSTIMHSISLNNGTNWSSWEPTYVGAAGSYLPVRDFVEFFDGVDNFIRWSAEDTLGNGPAVSEPYRVLVDTQPVIYQGPIPPENCTSRTEDIQVGITIIDNTSGVNASMIKYSTSIDNGSTWGSWKSVVGYISGQIVNLSLNLTFPNGTNNRIRWRAYDIAGNGPTMSEEYRILVDLPKEPEPPRTRLLAPSNNSKIDTKTLVLQWEPVEDQLPGIVFDIKLDKQFPPQDIIYQNYSNTSLTLDTLENGETYYWTVLPRLGKLNGTCLSGVWKFTMEIPLPQIELKTPPNGSFISSTRPTLVWAVQYFGTEKLSYWVYLDTTPEFDSGFYQVTTKYYSPPENLEEGKTYYWQVVPWAGGLKGTASEVWSFTVEFSNIPNFKLKLSLEPEVVNIMPGQIKFIRAVVTNLGDITDTIKISVNTSQALIISGSVYRQETKVLEPNEAGEFLIMVSAPDDSVGGQDALLVTANSIGAEQYDVIVRDDERLIVNIVFGSGLKNNAQTDNLINWLWILIFLIIIIICIILIILKRKKDESKVIIKKKKPPEEILSETALIPPQTPFESQPPFEPEPTVEPVSVPVQKLEENQTIQQDEEEE